MTSEEEVLPQEDVQHAAPLPEARLNVPQAADPESGTEPPNMPSPRVSELDATKPVGPRHIHTMTFLKALRDITDLGASMQYRSRELVNMQGFQLGSLGRILGNLHQEVDWIWHHLKDHIVDLQAEKDNTKEHNDWTQRMLQAHEEQLISNSKGVGRLQEMVREESDRMVEESKRISKTAAERCIKRESSRQDKMREDLHNEIRALDEAKIQQAKAIDDLTEQLAKLDTEFVQHVRRNKDEHRRYDTAVDVAHRVASELKEVKGSISSSSGLRKDLEGVAKVVTSLAADVNKLKDLPSLEPFSSLAQLPVAPVVAPVSIEGGSGVAVAANISVVGPSMAGNAGFQRSISAPAVDAASEHMEFSSVERALTQSTFDNPERLSSAHMQISTEQVDKFVKRLDQVELVEKELQSALESVERRVSQTYSHGVSMTNIKGEVNELVKQVQDIQTNISAQISKVETSEVSHAIINFRARWDLFATAISPSAIFKSWLQFIGMRHRMREALVNTKKLYAKRHAGARMQSWYYITQRCLNQNAIQQIEERSSSVQSQQEALSATVAKRERLATEQAKDLHCRISMVEKRLEVHSQKKADQDHVQELFDNFQKRWERDLDPATQKRATEELRKAILELDKGKADAAVSQRHGQQLRDLAIELREKLHRHDDELETKASKAENSQKANAQLVEQIVVLLARQADHLATLVSQDLELFRGVLGRFLELSPDIRKAALSLGLDPNERCVACRATDRKMVLTPLLGSDNAAYHSSPDTNNQISAETQKVVQGTLRFPSNLASSLAAGTTLAHAFGEQWRPIELPVAAEPAAAKTSSKPSAVQKLVASEPQVLLARLRKMILQDPGWIAGEKDDELYVSSRGPSRPPSATGSGTTAKRTVMFDGENGRVSTSGPSTRPSTAGDASGVGSSGRPGSARSGSGRASGRASGRQLVGARNYFRGSLAAVGGPAGC